MRVRLTCWQCGDDRDPVTTALAPLRDDGRYEISCNRHGRSVLHVQNLRFELLFEAGVLSLCEGRTRDAVLDMGAALERFVEFYLDFSRIRRGVPDAQYSRFWNRVRNASERQLGAFLVCHLLDHGEDAGPPGSWAPFRNRVIHQGYIPDLDETLDEGERLCAFMTATLDKARSSGPEALVRATVRAIVPDVEGSEASVAIHLPTLISTISNAHPSTLAAYLMRVQSHLREGAHHNLSGGEHR